MFERVDHGQGHTRKCSRLILPKVKTEAGRNTFTFKGVVIFNGLPNDIRNESYLVNFKQKIDTVNFI